MRLVFFRSFFVFSVLFSCFISHAQSWEPKIKENISPVGQIDINPAISKVFALDDAAIKAILWLAPAESETNPANSDAIITVPAADGQFDQFRMVQYDMMETELADKYPNIRTFHGVSVSDPHKRIRADYTDYGFRAVISDEGGNSYIDHYQRGDKVHKVVYYKKDLVNPHEWTCDFQEEEAERQHSGEDRAGDCIFRSYRLALATTAEYSIFHGATSAAQSSLVLSAVTVAMNRVNGVLEKDITIRFILVGTTSNIFYYDAATDPYTNGNGSTMLGENQTTCTNVIGAANYDMGHVFSTGGGGVAWLGSICESNNKAKGVTGSSSPVGDPFTIDYVAHEMGHQLGGNHTQYNNCNRVAAAAMEPGSASTIMGYAGICSPNVQNNSDAYYHARSIQEIKTELELPANNCYVGITFGNQPPAMSALSSYSIPISTPFVLTASATDPDGDPMVYCWEQMNSFSNPAQTMPPAATNTSGPAFRSLTPVSSPSRYFPALATVLAGSTANTWEVLPSVARTMTFRATVRDYHNIAGCTDEENMTVTTVAGIGPFTVTSQNSASSWTEGQQATIMWNVANTTNSPVSCANVDIYLSYDGGLTYPVTLVSGTPNDGNETITVPLGTSTSARFMVKGANNVFFDVNNANITILANPATFNLLAEPAEVSLCNTGSAQTTVTVLPVNGFNLLVTLSVLNLPPGASAVFSTNPVLPNTPVTLTISNLINGTGTLSTTIRGVSGNILKEIPFTLNLDAIQAAPTAVFPLAGATNVWFKPSLQWTGLSGINTYTYEVSLSSSFSFLSASGTTNTTSVVLPAPLTGGTTYFWRVRANNNCVANAWSSPISFTVRNCQYYQSGNVPLSISSAGPVTVSSSQTTYDKAVLDSLQVYDLEGVHSFMDNLKFFLSSPGGTEDLFWDRPCNDEDNFDINFSDAVSSSAHPCPPNNGLTYKPSNPLAVFEGASAYGSWKLRVEDIQTGDGGSLNNWAFIGCYTRFCRLLVEHPYTSGIGSLPTALICAEPGDTIRFSNTLKNQTIDLGNNNLVFSKNLVLLANPGDNITITSTSANPTLVIEQGKTIGLIGLNIRASNSTLGAISNSGVLNLTDVDLLKNPIVSPIGLLNSTVAASVNIFGSCTLKP
ncbi:MAG: proprotein convertase P-domain-containing protein [Saprospiraceae bacterium]|nr:proprotein convertase P-domain-containing protein [Saprospiraceae bacterium]